jgi:RNA recognition motif-containing protein
MGKNLFVGNLSFQITDQDLRALFEPHGEVASAKVIKDRDTNRSKGFGFVEMVTEDGAQAAISALNGQFQDGRSLNVNEAKPRESGTGGFRSGPPRSGGGGGRGGSGGGGGYGGGGGGGYGGGGGGGGRRRDY